MRQRFWWVIIAAKLIFSFVPFLKNIFQSLGFYSPGLMLDHSYAIDCFNEHYKGISPYANLCSDPVMIEFGPGGSNFSALIAHALGFSESILVDIEPLKPEVIESAEENYAVIKDKLQAEIVDQKCKSQSFKNINYKYLSDGVTSFAEIDSESVDLIWSHSVLQHVHIDQFQVMLREFHRVLKTGSLMSHKIDLKDCIAYGLNNMRFSDNIWNSERFFTSGFYTNRIRRDEMLGLFAAEGFALLKVNDVVFDQIPLTIDQSSKDIRERYNDEDFLYSGLHCVLKKI